MIIDTIVNARLYRGTQPLLDEALEMLDECSSEPLNEGRTDISGDDLYVIASNARGKTPQEAKLEAHRRYIDVHLLLDGNETIGWKPAGECALAATTYDQEKDVMLYGDQPAVWLPMTPGSFAVFFPADAHAPMVSEGEVRKLVFKIAISPATAA